MTHYLVQTPSRSELLDPSGLSAFLKRVDELMDVTSHPTTFRVDTVDEKEVVTCPSCKRVGLNRAHVKQVAPPTDSNFGIISVGFQCQHCDHVWGHGIE